MAICQVQNDYCNFNGLLFVKLVACSLFLVANFMINTTEIINFDAFGEFGRLLVGEVVDFPLLPETINRIKDPEQYKVITVKSSSQVSGAMLEKFPNLELLITRTVGTNHLDVEGIKAREIEVSNIPDYGAFSIAEHVFALLLTMTRKVIFLDKDIRNGVFSSKGAQGYTLEGKTMGVVGTGRIGKEIIRLSQAFHMRVVAYDLYPNAQIAGKMGFRYLSLEDLLKASDVVSINVPLTEETRHLFGTKELAAMKTGSVLINTSRGAVIDTKALIDQIDKFRHVGLDVVEDEEKFSSDHPLLNFKNVVITPHCAYFTDKSTRQIAEKTKELIEERFGRISN